MNNQVRVPFIEQRVGKPFNKYDKVGPFTLQESNKGNYFLYTVLVTGGVCILKQASKPGFYDICHALKTAFNEKAITLEVFDDYRKKADAFIADNHPDSIQARQAGKGRKK